MGQEIPSLNTFHEKKFFRSLGAPATTLSMTLGLLYCCGCATISIPSYRIHAVGQSGHLAQNQLMESHIAESSCVEGDGSECTVSSIQASEACDIAAMDECDPNIYTPVFPACTLPKVPTPRFWQRWKEYRNLPDGPDGLRFHPLPTRPMFQPKPADD